ncbi:MAG: MFS transporter [Candidatus Ranarchaeia archaeon]
MDDIFKDRVFLIALLITPVAMLGFGIVNVTIPEILGFYGITKLLPDLSPNPLYGVSASLISSVFVGSAIIITPLMGVIADKYGRRVVILPSLFTFAFTGPLIYLASTFEHFIIIRFIQGVAAAALFPIGDILIGDRFSGHTLTKAMGLMQSVFAIGNVITPVIGGFLAEIDWHLNFMVYLITIPIFLIVYKYLEETKPEETKAVDKKPLRARLGKLMDPTIILLILSGFALPFIQMSAIGTFLPILLKDQLGISPSLRGFANAGLWLVAAVVSSQSGRFIKKIRIVPMVAVAYGIFSIITFLYPFAPSFEYILLLACIMGIGTGLNRPLLRALTLHSVPKKTKATLVSVRTTFQRIGQTAGPLFFASFYTLGGISSVFLMISTTGWIFVSIILLSIAVAPYFYKTRERPGEKE